MKNKRRLLLYAIDLCIFIFTYVFAFLFKKWRFIVYGVEMPAAGLIMYLVNALIFFAFIAAARLIFKVYRNVWRYANSQAYLSIIVADVVGGGLALLLTYVLPWKIDGIGVLTSGWQSIGTIAIFDSLTLVSRFVYQLRYKLQGQTQSELKDSRITVAIVGAGRVGALLAEELLCYKGSYYRPVCFIDRDNSKIGSRISGLPVFAEDEKIFDKLSAFPVQEIIIAIPQLTGEDVKTVFEFYGQSGCKIKLYDFPRQDGDASHGEQKRVIREFKIEDLLFRDALKVTNSETKSFYEGKRVIVTGGGGSIGSELVRQIAKCNPAKLVVFDIYENNAYDIQQELIRTYGDSLDLAVEIGSVRDRARLDAVFAHYRPDIVFHAAAHKHVPLMEHSNCEAIKNNVMGTYNTADMAEKYGVKKFILISTDKAVNPTNVMGASKRMCEMVIQCRTDSKTVFSAVRFGNVLGSNGSVIPLFKRQIASGGPITLTDRRIIRYFMTIPEASGLVMQAGAMAKSGELFVLDMGKPIKIYDLATNMIKLSGLRPDVDIKIIETGLRPGEKLYEELLIKTETLEKTPNDMIFIERDTPFTREEIELKLASLRRAVEEAEGEIAPESVTRAMKEAVPTFRSPEEVNRLASEAQEMKAVMG